MAADTELDRLVVTMVGNGDSYQKMLKDAAANTTTATKSMSADLSSYAKTAEDSLGSVATGAKTTSDKLTTVSTSLKDFTAAAATSLALFGASGEKYTSIFGAHAESVQKFLQAGSAASAGLAAFVAAKAALFEWIPALTGVSTAASAASNSVKSLAVSLGPAGWVAVGAIAVETVAIIVGAYQVWKEAAEELKKTLESSAASNAEVLSRYEEGTAIILQNANNMILWRDRMILFGKASEEAEARANTFSKAIELQRKRLEEMQSFKNIFTGYRGFEQYINRGVGGREVEVAKQMLKEMEQLQEAARRRMEAVAEAGFRDLEKTMENAQKLISRMQFDDVTKGMTQVEKEAFRLKEALPTEDDLLDWIADLAEQGRDIDAIFRQVANAENQVEAAMDLAFVHSMEAELDKFDAQVKKMMESTTLSVAEIGKLKREMEAAGFRLLPAEEANLRGVAQRNELMREHNSLVREAGELTKRFAPEAGFLEEWERLDRMLAQNLISPRVYAEAWNALGEKYHLVGEEAHKAAHEIAGLHAVIAGSVPDAKLLSDWNASIREAFQTNTVIASPLALPLELGKAPPFPPAIEPDVEDPRARVFREAAETAERLRRRKVDAEFGKRKERLDDAAAVAEKLRLGAGNLTDAEAKEVLKSIRDAVVGTYNYLVRPKPGAESDDDDLFSED